MLIFMEAKTTLARRKDAVQGDFMRKMLTNAGCLLCGILVSRGAVLGSLAPFGASFAAAVPRKYLLSSLLGQLSLPCRCGGNRRSAVAAR